MNETLFDIPAAPPDALAVARRELAEAEKQLLMIESVGDCVGVDTDLAERVVFVTSTRVRQLELAELNRRKG